MTYTNEDSLKVTEQEDGTFSISWDENDPRYTYLNSMNPEELNAYFTNALEQYLKELNDE